MSALAQTRVQEVLAAALECVGDRAIVLFDVHGRITGWYAAARRLHGYEVDEILGRSGTLLHPDQAVAVRDHELDLKAARERGRCERRGWLKRKDGSRFAARLTVVPIRGREGELLGFVQTTYTSDAPEGGQGPPSAGRPQPEPPGWERMTLAVDQLFRLGMYLQSLALAAAGSRRGGELDAAVEELGAAIRQLQTGIFSLDA